MGRRGPSIECSKRRRGYSVKLANDNRKQENHKVRSICKSASLKNTPPKAIQDQKSNINTEANGQIDVVEARPWLFWPGHSVKSGLSHKM